MLIWDLLNSIGAIAIFIFGMKVMSDGVQKASDDGFRAFVNSITNDKTRAFLSGLGLTSVIQSSSAVCMVTLSFVNAGLINLIRAFTIIISANIGTTITLWIVSLGFEISMITFSLPLFAIAIPFYLSTNSKLRAWANFAIGFALIFIALNLFKENLSFLFEQSEILESITKYGKSSGLSSLVMLIIGLLLTAILQSSSASTSAIVVLHQLGLPLETCAMMIIGANIGTTVTAQIAASTVGNIYTKLTAHFHTFFNVLGALIFFFFVGNIIQFLKGWIGPEEDYFILASFHTIFNIGTAIVVFPFLDKIAVFCMKRVRGQMHKKSNKIIHSSINLSPDLYIYEANKKLISFSGNIRQTITNLGRLITESDEEKLHEIHQRIIKLESEGDQMERDIMSYLNKIYMMDITTGKSKKIHDLMMVSKELENIGDLAIKISYTHLERRSSNSYITPKLRTHLIEIQDVISAATTHLSQNLNEMKSKAHLKKAKKLEKRINKLYDEAFKNLINTTEKNKIKPLSALYYRDLIQYYEIIGDHIYRANQNLWRLD